MTRANHKTIFLLAYLGLFASGCITNSGRATPSVLITSSSTFVASNVGVLEQTPSPMAIRDNGSMLPSQQSTLEKPPSTLVPTNTTTLFSTATPTQLVRECSLANAELKPDFMAEGTLIFNNQGIIYTISNDDLEMRPFLGDLPCCFYNEGTSPNHKWLAITHEVYNSAGRFVNRDLVLTNGYEQKIIPWRENWSPTIYGWLNDDYLKVFLNTENEQGIVGMILFEPFTEQEREFPVNFSYSVDVVNPRSPSFTTYAPDLSRVVYLNYEEEDRKRTLYLWDIENQLTLWDFQLPHPIKQMFEPRWSPDSRQFIVVPPDEDGYKVFLVTREGKVNQIVEETLPIFYIRPAWSPDSQKVAFTLQDSVVIYDIPAQQLTEYCVSKSLGYDFEPVWSPDGKQIMVLLGSWDIRPEFNTVQNIIIDITTGSIAKLDNNLIPIAWLEKAP
jgi:hypothetical protein